ncbi:hypothetical protein PQX77_021840 [Marasmius sp. AFHP31]|nr:hypothetical protein PQX77_021840 [Marasmius sp. AFHP31]
MASERDPLLDTTQTDDLSQEDATGESFDNVPKSKRQLGLFSAIVLIFNRVVGTGIYATPSTILRASGSVGIALIMWVVGALIAAAGTAVFIELGTGLPWNGGEKNYLEYMFWRPPFLTTCIYAAYTIVIGTSVANGIMFGEYTLHALGVELTHFNTRLVAYICLTFIVLVHGTRLQIGLQLQNTLGLLKLIVLSAIALCGLLLLAGIPGFEVNGEYNQPDNFDWDNFWEGSRYDTNSFVSGLYDIIWSFMGYSNANYVLSEVCDPVKTIKQAAPLAMATVTTVYLLINIGYFAVVSKADILESKRIIVALFFQNLFGETTERVLSAFVALSTLGNLLSVQFVMGRVIQELGREGLLPFSSFFASNKPFDAPLAGLFSQYVVSCILMILPPPGDVYMFMITLSSYASSLVNLAVSLGLLLLYTSAYRTWDWNPPFRAYRVVVVTFFVSNVFLVVVPFIPPAPNAKTYDHLPYWVYRPLTRN